MIRTKSIECFRGELERAAAIGAEHLVLHPGSYRGSSVEEGIAAFVLGLRDASPLEVAGPAVILPWLKHGLRADTRQAGLKGGSFMQMPGTFVIDDTGMVRFAHRNRHVADSPRTEALLDAIAGRAIARQRP